MMGLPQDIRSTALSCYERRSLIFPTATPSPFRADTSQVWTPFAQRCSIWIEETLGDAGGGNLAQVTTLCENEAYGRYRPGRTHTNHGRCGDGDWQQYLTGPQHFRRLIVHM